MFERWAKPGCHCGLTTGAKLVSIRACLHRYAWFAEAVSLPFGTDTMESLVVRQCDCPHAMFYAS